MSANLSYHGYVGWYYFNDKNSVAKIYCTLKEKNVQTLLPSSYYYSETSPTTSSGPIRSSDRTGRGPIIRDVWTGSDRRLIILRRSYKSHPIGQDLTRCPTLKTISKTRQIYNFMIVVQKKTSTSAVSGSRRVNPFDSTLDTIYKLRNVFVGN